MKRTSSPVRSSQIAVHKRLQAVVQKNLNSSWQQPLHRPTVDAFEKLLRWEDIASGTNLILDSGCGTGASTRSIAALFPDSTVIGIDRSAARLSRLGRKILPFREGNTIWIQAELATFWRLGLQQKWQLGRHYLLYPNPWPKPGQLQRRWHAHPVFPQMLALGGVMEMRCNWEIYAEEFVAALGLVYPGVNIKTEAGDSEQSWGGVSTPFGRKYANSGHRLYRVVADLG